jgi:hypothetical protein
MNDIPKILSYVTTGFIGFFILGGIIETAPYAVIIIYPAIMIYIIIWLVDDIKRSRPAPVLCLPKPKPWRYYPKPKPRRKRSYPRPYVRQRMVRKDVFRATRKATHKNARYFGDRVRYDY